MQRARMNNRKRNWKKLALMALSGGLIVLGFYIAILVIAPQRWMRVPIQSGIDLNTKDDANDRRDRIQIEKINLEVPFYTGDKSALDRGAWHRYPERGDPEKGGNFILSAHRFDIGTTPAETKLRSPFYNVGSLKVGDKIRIFYQGKWYNYEITRTYQVKPSAVEIEAPSEKAKLTLYSCSLAGSSDGRIVIEATTKDGQQT